MGTRSYYPSFTRRDFQFIADLLAADQPNPETQWCEWIQWATTVRNFTKAFKATNPRFDADRFQSACGLVEGPTATGK